MLPSQRREAGTHIAHMVRWCLSRSLDRDGVLFNPDQGDQIPDSYYFAAAFLDTIGFFDPAKKFWTAHDLPDWRPIKTGVIAELSRFHPDLTVVDDALERLGGSVRPWSNAIL
jgi:hypothetical protein